MIGVRERPPSVGNVFELRVTLREIEPPIWRALRVPATTTLAELHNILQIALGWQNCHLHDFLVDEIRFASADAEDDGFGVDERGAPLGAVARASSKFLYRYDFGDGWDHDVVVARVDTRGDGAIRCIGGARACPPEDCGAPHGYAQPIKVLANPKDPEHPEMKRWVPRDFDAEKFDLAAVNSKLATRSRRR